MYAFYCYIYITLCNNYIRIAIIRTYTCSQGTVIMELMSNCRQMSHPNKTIYQMAIKDE